MSKNKRTQKNDVSDMSSVLASHVICTMLPARSFLRWSDDLHMIFVRAVAHQGGPHEAKPTALKETMEAMGVVGLTIQNIKSHLQRYREKCQLSAEAPADEVPGTASLSKEAINQKKCELSADEVAGTTSLSKAAHNQTSKILLDTDAVMPEMEIVNNFLLDDIEMVDNNFSVDQVQMMEKELMDEIHVAHGYNDSEANFSCPQLIEHNSQYPQAVIDEYMANLDEIQVAHSYNDSEASFSCPELIEHNSQYPQTVIDEYMADLANYAFGRM
ncbi:unnamed protein product [Urochloa humidicola]